LVSFERCINDAATPVQTNAAAPLVIPVSTADDVRFELLCCLPPGQWKRLLYWIPAMGMPARHYLPVGPGAGGTGSGDSAA